MKIITEEMRFRKRLCEFALKYGVTKAAKRYHTNRQFVYRQLEKYDGTLRSLALQSRKPHSHPNAHTKEELTLIKQIYSRYGCDGLAEVYVQLRKRGYKRSYGSMLKQIKKIPKEKVKIRKGYTRHKEIRGQYPGDKVQVDIKYVPKECLLFDTIDKKYYQITAIDESKDTACASAIEYYYEDNNYKYYFTCIKSGSIFVIVDGKKYNIKEALNNKVVTMAELESNGFKPLKEEKNLQKY